MKSYITPLCRWSEIQTNIQHMQLIRVLYTAVAYNLVYRHGMKRKLAISSLLCVTINCLTIGDHVKMLLT